MNCTSTRPHEHEAVKSTVLIASESVLAKWSSLAAPADLITLADADAEQALAVIERRRPHFVVLSQIFAASEAGALFVNRLRANVDLAGLEIKVLPDQRSAVLGATGPVTGRLIASVSKSLRLCAVGSTRRGQRLPAPLGSEIDVNGVRADLINVSPYGVQVVSPIALKPNSNVTIGIDQGGIELCTNAAIAWSALEMARSSIAYRVGIAFPIPRPELLKIGVLDGPR